MENKRSLTSISTNPVKKFKPDSDAGCGSRTQSSDLNECDSEDTFLSELNAILDMNSPKLPELSASDSPMEEVTYQPSPPASNSRSLSISNDYRDVATIGDVKVSGATENTEGDIDDPNTNDVVGDGDGAGNTESYTDGADSRLISFDDLSGNDSDNEVNSDNENSAIEGVDDDEVDSWLEAGLSKGDKAASQHLKPERNDGESGHEVKDKLVLIECTEDPFDFLPEDWLMISHSSGMPLYLHRTLRVCTLSKPYFLGRGSARHHDIPISAVPCLQYRRFLDKSRKTQDNSDSSAYNSTTESATSSQEKDIDSTENVEGSARIECLADSVQRTSLGADELTEYCQRLFKFRSVKVRKFKNWKDRRNFQASQARLNRPSLPSNTKLITFPVTKDKSENPTSQQYSLNLAGKSHVCILHEYCQHALKMLPKYTYAEHENPLKPFSATVTIGNSVYATGYAQNKRVAKSEAARITINVLIPGVKDIMNEKASSLDDLSYFNDVRIKDPRALYLCHRAEQPTPYMLLLECLKRNYGMHDSSIHTELKVLGNQKKEYIMSVGKHSCAVSCKNKKEGKQLAAQYILQSMHPHLDNFGSLLQLYGRASMDIGKDMKQEVQAVTELQAQCNSDRSNSAIIEKLRFEMKKLKAQKDFTSSKGKDILGMARTSHQLMTTNEFHKSTNADD